MRGSAYHTAILDFAYESIRLTQPSIKNQDFVENTHDPVADFNFHFDNGFWSFLGWGHLPSEAKASEPCDIYIFGWV